MALPGVASIAARGRDPLPKAGFFPYKRRFDPPGQ